MLAQEVYEAIKVRLAEMSFVKTPEQRYLLEQMVLIDNLVEANSRQGCYQVLACDRFWYWGNDGNQASNILRMLTRHLAPGTIAELYDTGVRISYQKLLADGSVETNISIPVPAEYIEFKMVRVSHD